jgi:hypothetical protein
MTEFKDPVVGESRVSGCRVKSGGLGSNLVLIHAIDARSGPERVNGPVALGMPVGWSSRRWRAGPAIRAGLGLARHRQAPDRAGFGSFPCNTPDRSAAHCALRRQTPCTATSRRGDRP